MAPECVIDLQPLNNTCGGPTYLCFSDYIWTWERTWEYSEGGSGNDEEKVKRRERDRWGGSGSTYEEEPNSSTLQRKRYRGAKISSKKANNGPGRAEWSWHRLILHTGLELQRVQGSELGYVAFKAFLHILFIDLPADMKTQQHIQDVTMETKHTLHGPTAKLYICLGTLRCLISLFVKQKQTHRESAR